MGCSCGTAKNGSVSGCRNNGACNTGGCNKMNVFDWLSNMEMPREDKFNVVEVRFKNGRKEFFTNPEKLNLTTGDAVVVEVPSGHHVGYVSMQGELVRLQMQKKKITLDGEIKKIYRIAHQKDLDKFEEVKKREMPTLYRTREIIRDLKLEMKLSDIEYQADNAKATFFYSADDRVDFRELIKLLAGEFRIRVEMRQISLRQEAGRLGGIGVCGRELCCSTWLTDFKNVATSAARYQNLSLNPSKLSGQCGRLKCCLNYELETYMEALEHIPKIEGPLLTEKGEATLQKTDIFRKIMWFGFVAENTWYPLNIERVNEILAMNREGRKPASLDLDVEAEKIPVETLNSDLARMDQKFKGKAKKRKKKKGPGEDQPRGNSPSEQKAGNQQPRREHQGPRGDRPERGERPERQDRGEPRRDRPSRGEPRGESRGGNARGQRNEQRGEPRNQPTEGQQGQPAGQQSSGQGQTDAQSGGQQSGGQPSGGQQRGQQRGSQQRGGQNQPKDNQQRNQQRSQGRNNPGNRGGNPNHPNRSGNPNAGKGNAEGGSPEGNPEGGNSGRRNQGRNQDRGNSGGGNPDRNSSDNANRNSNPGDQQ